MEHETLRNDLEGLELLNRETRERLAQIETRYSGKYPQVDVIERVFLPGVPIGPDYWFDMLIALAGSLGFSLFCVWLSEFLTRKEQSEPIEILTGIPAYEQGLLSGVPTKRFTTHECIAASESSLAGLVASGIVG